jgi:hypothetical protein
MAAMKTDLLVLAGTVLLFAALPMVSYADEADGSAERPPLAMGEPMEDCDLHRHDVLTLEPAAAPARAPTGSTTQFSPAPSRRLSPATLLTFALIASPGTALPQTGGGARD